MLKKLWFGVGLVVVAIGVWWAKSQNPGLIVYNRTTSAVVLRVDGSQLVVQACSERWIQKNSGNVGARYADGMPTTEPAPSGAPIVDLGTGAYPNTPETAPKFRLFISPSLVVDRLEDGGAWHQHFGMGSFPPDPNSVPCQGRARDIGP